eukprot:436448_1
MRMEETQLFEGFSELIEATGLDGSSIVPPIAFSPSIKNFPSRLGRGEMFPSSSAIPANRISSVKRVKAIDTTLQNHLTDDPFIQWNAKILLTLYFSSRAVS